MPTYSYQCYAEDGGCGHQFEVKREVSNTATITCPECKKRKPVGRDFQADSINFFGPTKTLGSQADKNRASMSNDAVQAINRRNTKHRRKSKDNS